MNDVDGGYVVFGAPSNNSLNMIPYAIDENESSSQETPNYLRRLIHIYQFTFSLISVIVFRPPRCHVSLYHLVSHISNNTETIKSDLRSKEVKQIMFIF